MFYERYLNILELLKNKSLLLLGPRQTGKSTLATTVDEGTRIYNLAEADTFRELAARPELIRQRLSKQTRRLVIDEVQRLPELFNEVQVMLDRDKLLRVLLTGSSARKLRRGNTNLLPGRVWKRVLHPLVYPELGEARIETRACRGSLPAIIDAESFEEELRNYVGIYLEEEIRAEGLTRNIGGFSRFLNIAALCNTEQVNYTGVANDAQVSVNTARAYFQILYDTLIGYELPPYKKTPSRKAVSTPKFYLFDPGVANALLGRFQVMPGNDLFGKALEHIIFQELRAYLDYNSLSDQLYYWRSLSRLEVDFLIGDHTAIEVKATRSANPRDERGLRALAEDLTLRRRIIVCTEKEPRRTESGCEVLPAEEFCRRLWAGEIF